MTARFVGLAAVVLACLLFVVALQRQTAPLSPQSLANRHFATTADYALAVSELNRVWPPLYPSLLWSAVTLGVPLSAVNTLLFFVSLGLLYVVGRRVTPAVEPVWAIALYASAGFNAFNLHQLTAEALLVPLALGVLIYTLKCINRGRSLDHAVLGVLLGAACLTRYFAFAWLLPLVGLALGFWGPRSTRERSLRAAAVLLAASVPAAAWMLYARSTTGFLTGMERFVPRGFDAETSLLGNLSHAARTLAFDFFAPGLDASPASLAAASGGLLTLALSLLAIALCVWCAAAAITSASTPLRLLLPGLSVGYVAVLLVIWTLGNNDPIYSRFLYPSYVFFVLAGMHVYSQARLRGVSSQPFVILYGLLLVSHLGGGLVSVSGAG